jgi:hypothetical protein
MKRLIGMAILNLVCVAAIGVYAADDVPRSKISVLKDSAANPAAPKNVRDDDPLRLGFPERERRAVSREGTEYLQRLLPEAREAIDHIGRFIGSLSPGP